MEHDQPSLDSLELVHLKKRVAELEEREVHAQADYEHLKQLYENSPLAYQSLDVNGCLVEINQAWLEMLRYAGEEVVGRNFGDFLHPDSQEYFREQFSRFKITGEILGIELKMVRKDGASFRVFLQGKMSEAPRGQARQIHCIFHDITKHKQEETALRESEERFQALYKASFGGIVIHDHEGILDCNQGLSRLSGYTLEELIGMDRLMLIAPDYRNLVLRNMQRGFEQTYEIVGLKKDGTRFPIRVRGTNIPYKGRIVRMTEFRDITKYKQMEEALEKRLITRTFPLTGMDGITFEELFDLAAIQRLQDQFAAATGVASLIVSPDGTPITLPSKFTRLCGIIRKTMLGGSNCVKSDAAIGGYNPSGPIVQPCLSGGLWDAGARITIGGHHVASWLIGQVRNEAQDDESMRTYARAIGADEAAFMEAFHEVPSMSRERFEHIAQALFSLANLLSNSAYQGVQHARFIIERKRTEERCEKLRARLRQAEKMESSARLVCDTGRELEDIFTIIREHADLGLADRKPEDPHFQCFGAIRDAVQRSAGPIRQLLAFCLEPADGRQPGNTK